MLKPVAGTLLAAAVLLAGCTTTTTTTTCTIGNICWETTEPTPTHNNPKAEDHTAVFAVVGALVAGIALAALLHHRSDDDDDVADAPGTNAQPPSAFVPAAPTVNYVLPPTTNPAERRLQRMFVQAHISARAGRCEAVTAIGKRLAMDSPRYHERYVADPTIAQCLTAH